MFSNLLSRRESRSLPGVIRDPELQSANKPEVMVEEIRSIAYVHPSDAIAEVGTELDRNGFAVIRDFYPNESTDKLVRAIAEADSSRPTFRKTAGLFAIRQFLKEIPDAAPLILNDALQALTAALLGEGYFPVKSIYFDKPEASNWFVAYHQDLSISVDRRGAFPGFGPWTVKQDQFAVQPPLPVLEDNITIRIHLDDTTAENGALRVVPGSHQKGIYRPENIDWTQEREVICEVPKGGIMLMRPLLLHASGRTTNNRPRRVVHIELSRSVLPEGLRWAELS
jgi:hypothetical protein